MPHDILLARGTVPADRYQVISILPQEAASNPRRFNDDLHATASLACGIHIPKVESVDDVRGSPTGQPAATDLWELAGWATTESTERIEMQLREAIETLVTDNRAASVYGQPYETADGGIIPERGCAGGPSPAPRTGNFAWRRDRLACS